MGYEKVKRNRFYEAPYEFPHSSIHHFEDQEEFHTPLNNMHNANLHDWGLARGLEVSGAIGGSEVVVHAGVAIDAEGRLISLSPIGHGDIGANPMGAPPQNDEVTVPVHLSTGPHAGQTVYVTVQFSEILRPGEGSGGRMEQVPWIRLQPATGTGAYTDDGTSIILAVAEINGSGNLTSLTATSGSVSYGRRLVGSSIEELRVQRSTKAGNSVEQTTSGKIGPGESSGLKISVPGASDNVTISRENGSILSDLEIRASEILGKDNAGLDALRFRSAYAWLTVGTDGNEGDLEVKDGAGRSVMHLDGGSATLNLGANENGGDINVKDSQGRTVMNFNSSYAALYLGANGNEGDLIVRDSEGRDALVFDSNYAWLTVGNEGNEGDIEVKDGSGRRVMHFDGGGAWLAVGADGNAGDIEVKDGEGRRVFHFDSRYAALYLGAEGNEGDLVVRNSSGVTTAQIDGQTGRLTSNGHIIAGNPARYVQTVWLFADDGTDTAEIDLGSTRQVFAYVCMVGMDPRHDFDSGDAFAVDIYSIDGSITGSWIHNGAHFGGDGANSNFKTPAFWGQAQRILFRARSWQDASVFALGVVFYE